MKLVYISDFDIRGSGYANLSVELCSGLTASDHEVLALGLHYDGRQHDYPFSIIPVTAFGNLAHMVAQLGHYGQVAALIVALDIPLQEALLNALQIPTSRLPYIGVFPLEAGPLCASWAVNLHRMSDRLVMSRFAVEELAEEGVPSTFIPIGIDCSAWKMPSQDERTAIRDGLGIPQDAFVVLTVADNHERKNLSRTMEIFQETQRRLGTDCRWLVVTRPNSSVGWKLDDYALELGILPSMHVWSRGVPFKQLWALYAGADAFLLTSKAEGLAMPVLEAMATGTLVVGTDCTAISEHIRGGQGIGIQPDYVLRDPWGNSRRYLASLEDGVRALLEVAHMGEAQRQEIRDRARQYVERRKWQTAWQVLEAAVHGATDGSLWEVPS